MDIFKAMALLDELSKLDKESIKYALETLMMQGKIDYVDLSQSYVECLNRERKDQEEQLCEANGLLLLPFIGKKLVKSKDSDKTKGKSHYRYTQEALYWLNRSRMFNMKSTNEEFSYDEDYGKEQCVYERNKKNDW